MKFHRIRPVDIKQQDNISVGDIILTKVVVDILYGQRQHEYGGQIETKLYMKRVMTC